MVSREQEAGDLGVLTMKVKSITDIERIGERARHKSEWVEMVKSDVARPPAPSA